MSHPLVTGENAGPALLALYDRTLGQVYGYLLSRCGQRALAEDLTSETFLVAVTPSRCCAPRFERSNRTRPSPPPCAPGWSALCPYPKEST